MCIEENMMDNNISERLTEPENPAVAHRTRTELPTKPR